MKQSCSKLWERKTIMVERKGTKLMKKKMSVLDIGIVLVAVIGGVARAIFLQTIPGGINQDEAFSAYEALSLMRYGKDSFGYSFPVYLTTWGSGMSALNSYLMIPFMSLFGIHTWVVRLPQMITSCLSLLIMYQLFYRLFDKKAAFIALLYLAVCPYHIMMARWGLDCNLAPAFLLFGFYFFVCGVENNRYYLLSALCYGLSLYSYATVWPVVPFMIALQFAYVLYTRQFRLNRYTILFVLILGCMAAPLFLFLFVNFGNKAAIKLGLITIPKMAAFRESDISFDNLVENLKNLIKMLIKQNDGLIWNATEKFGLYYKGFLLFAAVGFLYGIYRGIKSVISHTYDPLVMMLFPLVCAMGLGAIVEVNVNRINCIHIPIITFIITGIYLIVLTIQKKFEYALPIVSIALLVLFCFFEQFYFTTFKDIIGARWKQGLEEAVIYAEELYEEDEAYGGVSGSEQIGIDYDCIYVDHSFHYPRIMYYSQIPVDEYRETVQYTNYPAEFLDAYCFGHYVFDLSQVAPGDLCIIPLSKVEEFASAGFEIVTFDSVAVAK